MLSADWNFVGETRQVTDAVHAKGSFIFVQLWALGRTADPEQLKSEDPNLPFVAPSPIPLSAKPTPRALTVEGQHRCQYFRSLLDL